MKDLFFGVLAGFVVFLLMVGVLCLGGWAVAFLLNIVLLQIGVASNLTMFGGICLIGAFSIIYHIAK